MNWLAPLTFYDTIKNLTLITHKVPAARVRRFLPPELELQTTFEDGVEKAFVSATCFYNQDFRFGAAGVPRLNFFQSTYRAYCLFEGRPSVFFFKMFLGTPSSFVLMRPACRDAHIADFNVINTIQLDDERMEGSFDSGEGRMHYAISSKPPLNGLGPFPSEAELARFVTYRPLGFCYGPGGILMCQRVQHRPMTPWRGSLMAGRFEVWERLGILNPDEGAEAFAVHSEPVIPFAMFPPLPVRVLPRRISNLLIAPAPLPA